jgi:hypothetical protein
MGGALGVARLMLDAGFLSRAHAKGSTMNRVIVQNSA